MIRDEEILEQLLDSIRRFVRERLIPLEEQVADEDRVPDDVISEMKELGLYGLSIPEEYGGLGLTMEEEVLAAFEVGKTAPAFRSAFGTNNGIGSQGIILDGTDEQKQRYLPRLATGEIVASFCLTEPDSGSDAASLRTSARKDGDEYILNGTKRWITNAPSADVFTVMARTNPEEKGARGISAFVVDRDTPGVSLGAPYKKMGQHGAPVCDVIFDDARVPAANLIGGQEGTGFKTAMKVLDKGRLHISAVCVGVAERLIEEAMHFALERKQFGQRIADFQLIQALLADSRAECYAARSMILETARLRDQRPDVSEQAACCKMFASEMVGRVADRAVQIHGGAGYMREYAVERLYRDVRLFRIYEGTTQIQQLVIARNMIRNAE